MNFDIKNVYDVSLDHEMEFLSLYQSTSLSVSKCVCLFPNSSKMANPSELKF